MGGGRSQCTQSLRSLFECRLSLRETKAQNGQSRRYCIERRERYRRHPCIAYERVGKIEIRGGGNTREVEQLKIGACRLGKLKSRAAQPVQEKIAFALIESGQPVV